MISAVIDVFDVDHIDDFICCKSLLYPDDNPFVVVRIDVRYPIT